MDEVRRPPRLRNCSAAPDTSHAASATVANIAVKRIREVDAPSCGVEAGGRGPANKKVYLAMTLQQFKPQAL